MAMGWQAGRQGEMILAFDELPRSPGHVFDDCLQEVLIEAGFDAFAADLCQPYDAAVMGAPSLPPGRYVRLHLVGYCEGIGSERRLEWRCADSLSLRDFFGLGLRQRVPDHSWLSRTRARLPLEVHEQVFAWVLARRAERGLVKGEQVGVDASTLEGNAAMRAIHRRDRPRDADALGAGERDRDAERGRAQAARPAAPGQADLERRVGEPERSRGQDHPSEGRPHPARLQARARG